MILRNNTLLQNRYLILGLLGQGGFGAVYEARDQRLGHRVALKQLTLSGQHVQKAFEREARILARLKHGALPKVCDYFADANGYFLVMEFIEGDDLKAMLAQRREPFPVEMVLGWAFQVLEALEYLHGQQPPVVHRDIKPANIKISPAGKLYLLDFGISKGGRTHTDQAMSGASIKAFSPRYASIEQIEGDGTDERSDLYSLAVTLHHLLTKQKPPKTVSRARAKGMHQADPLRPVNELNPLVPLGVAQVLNSTLNFDPALRPDSAHTMRQMLQEAIRPRQAPHRREGARGRGGEGAKRRSKTAHSSFQSQLSPWLIAVGGVIVLILGIFLGSMLIGNPEATPETALLPSEVPIVTEEPTIRPTIETTIRSTIEPTIPLAPSPTPTNLPAVATLLPTNTPIVPTITLVIEPTEPLATEATAMPTVEIVTEVPTNTPDPTGFTYLLASQSVSFDGSCNGHYILGIVTALDGTPLAGITVQAVDEYDNWKTAVTKDNPLGQYNIPISSDTASYQVMIVSGAQQLSAGVTLQHTDRFRK